MKRYILIVAAVALATVSCSRNYDVNPAGEGAEIGFGTWAENLTKAEAREAGTSTFLAGDTFAVYGYKAASDDSGKTTAFDDDVVTASGSGSLTWDYPNHRFWDVNFDKYVFFGISPSAIGTAAEVNAQTGAITSQTISFTGKNNDILVAEKTTVNKGDSPYFNNYGTVNMVFNHVASLVDLKVKKSPALANATVTVSAIAFENIQSAGVLTVTEYNKTTATSSNGAAASWSSTATASYGPASGVESVDITSPIEIAQDPAFNAATPAAPTGSTDLIKKLVVKPQTFDDTKNASVSQKLTVTYQVAVTDGAGNSSSNEYTSTLWLSDFDIVDDAAQDDTKVASWEAGKHYTFYITIDANEIKFSASINDWVSTDATGYHYLLN